MKVIFLGAPGTGKGTQASVLAERFQIPQISTGDILRKAVQEGTTLGKQAKTIMDAGELVPDEIIIQLIEERTAQRDCGNGYIFDGFPRTLKQAQSLDALLADPLDAVIYFEVAENEIIKRLTSRRTCRACGRNYNILSDPPPADLICETCGGAIIQRDDDSEATVRNRLVVYQEKTAPLIDYYTAQQKLITINGAEPVEVVRKNLIMLFEKLANRRN